MKLNVNYISRRQRELGLSRREIARALNITLTRVTSLYQGNFHGTFTLEQLGRLADALTCPLGQLLLHEKSEVDLDGAEDAPIDVIASLLMSADGPVSLSTLAEALGTDLAVTEAAVLKLDAELECVGLAIRRSSNDGAISIVAAAVASDEQLQTVLRGAQARQDIGTSAATLLYRIMTERVTPRSVESTNDRRVQLGRLVNAGFVVEGAKRTLPADLSDDVRESLLLDVR
jgi:transcriptional regulator with XRE-family HTH domain